MATCGEGRVVLHPVLSPCLIQGIRRIATHRLPARNTQRAKAVSQGKAFLVHTLTCMCEENYHRYDITEYVYLC